MIERSATKNERMKGAMARFRKKPVVIEAFKELASCAREMADTLDSTRTIPTSPSR